MYKRAILALLICVACAFSSPSPAQNRYSDDGPQVMPLERILPGIRSGRAGRFYDAEGPFPDANGGYHYRIKWLTPEGRVIWLDTDARSGRVLGTARGDWREQGPEPVGPMYNGGRPRFGAPGPAFEGARGFQRPAFGGNVRGPVRGNFGRGGRGHRG